MNNGHENSIAIPVEIAIDGSYRHDGTPRWQDAFETRLQRRASRLVVDLGLPALIRIQFAWRWNLQVEPAPPFSLHIDGQACRLDWARNDSWDAPPADLAEQVFEVMYWNRSLLVTPKIIEKLTEQYEGSLSSGFEAPSGAQLNALLDYGLRYGHSIPMCIEALRRWASARDSNFRPDYAFEWLLAHRFPREVIVEFGRAQMDALTDWEGMVDALRETLFNQTGVKFPRARAVFSEDLDDDQFRVCIGSIAGPVYRGLGTGEILVNDPPNQLQLLNIVGKERLNPSTGRMHSVVAEEHASLCESAGLTVWNWPKYVMLVVESDLRRQAAVFITMPQVEHLFKRLNDAFPMSVFNTMERFHMAQIQAVLRLLAEEGVSIRNLRDVLEALVQYEGVVAVGSVDDCVIDPLDGFASYSPSAPDDLISHLAAHVRAALRWQLAEDHLNPALMIEIGEATENRLHVSAQPPTAEDKRRLHSMLAQELRAARRAGSGLVILTSASIRRSVYGLISTEFPRLSVVARDEFAPTIRVRTKAMIDPFAEIAGARLTQ
jgi:hypothetical protein